MPKVKIVCRSKNGEFQQQFFSDGEVTDAAQQDAALAKQFLDAFTPEQLTQDGAERYGEDFVLVMRTDDTQMQEFDALLKEHENAE